MVRAAQEQHPRLLTRAEVAEVFHVSPATVTRWAEEGRLPSVKTLGGHRRYAEGVIEQMARRLTGGTPMDSILLNVDALYADHHVTEVRNLLAPMPGVLDVWASAAWRQVEVTYDPQKTSAGVIVDALESAGYPASREAATHRPPEPSSTPPRTHDPGWDRLGQRVARTNPLDLAMQK